MKYLRSYLLVPGAGGQILGTRLTACRPSHRLLCHPQVTNESCNYVCFPGFGQKRLVTTDGAKKSQLAVVGQVAPALPPPDGAELGSYVRPDDDKRNPRSHDSKSCSVDDRVCPLHGANFPRSPEESKNPSYGQILSECNSLKGAVNSLDPVSLEMAFLPTFHSVRDEVSCLFVTDRPKSAGIPYCPVSSPPKRPYESIPVIELDRSKSLDVLLPADSVLDKVDPPVTIRSVKREIVLPRPSESPSAGNSNSFLEIHNFQKKDSGEEDKSEDICPFPKSDDAPDPSGLAIHNDRTSIIIHRDLYITNRILEKLKQMEDKQEITPEPTVRASSLENPCATGVGVGGSCRKSLIDSDSAALADIGNCCLDPASLCSSVTAKETVVEAVTDPTNPQDGSLSVPGFTGSQKIQTIESPISEIQNGKSGSRLTNAEFDMPTDRLTRLESLALQSRKNLYERMKNVSSPCVLIDGVHVRRSKVEEALPSTDNDKAKDCTKSGLADYDCSGHVSCERNPILGAKSPVIGQSFGGTAPSVSSHALGDSIMNHFSKRTNQDDLPQVVSSVSPTLIESLTLGVFSNPHTQSLGLEENIDAQVQGFSEVNASDIAGYELGPCYSNGDLVQNDLEDWFIPLGKEIESMLLTLEASKKPLENYPEPLLQEFEEGSLDFEDVPNIRESGDSLPLEDVDTIESVLLSPRGLQPFEPGQSRDNSTTAGSKPPNAQNPNVDIKTETTIKCTRSGGNTDINVTETQRYLDKRLPYPFCTETVLQVCGKSSSLHEATQAVENSKSQLVHLSNANSPNPGILTPKLQFNHMLSKSHENVKSNSKKTVLKIKVVPNPAPSSSARSSEPKPQPSHILQLSEEPSKMSTDVTKLIRRSKFNQKTGPKKARRGDTMMKLRPKKKLNKESSENIKVLSPKELEKMFPSPPKPKPVEKPRKVTVETKVGKDYPELVEAVKEKSYQSGFIATQSKSRKVQDDILKKSHHWKSPSEIKVENQPNAPGVTMTKADLTKAQNDSALSTRDQKILKSIISHKVKDSFMAVTKNDPKPEADKLGTISQLVNSFPAPETKHEKSSQVYQNDPKSVYSNILGTAKEKPMKEKTPLKTPRPKSPRPESPTPKPNREYITIKTVPNTKTSPVSKATPATPNTKPEKKPDESVLPVSAMIANVMKGSTSVPQSEAKWHHLDRKTASEGVPEEKLPQENNPKTLDVQKRPQSDKLSARQKSQMREAQEVGKAKPNEQKELGKIADEVTLKDKNVWNLASGPLFFPFETPNYKEMLQEIPSDAPNPILTEPSVPISQIDSPAHEMDFCKLCSENTPGLDQMGSRYRVPLDRMKSFPLVNPGKPKMYSVPSSGAMSISPFHDVMLMRNLRRIPAVTKVLGATLSAKSQQALDRWKQGLISTLGEEGFQEFYQNQLKRGSDFHSTVRKFLADRLECKDDLCMQSLSKVMGSVSEVSVVESQVVHPLLGYRGVIDCVAKYKGKPVVIEWKRSDKTKPSLKHTYDAPLQLSAYFGAMNFDRNYKDQQVEGGVVVVAYSDGSPADVFELSVEECERYWSKWLRRLHQFYGNTSVEN